MEHTVKTLHGLKLQISEGEGATEFPGWLVAKTDKEGVEYAVASTTAVVIRVNGRYMSAPIVNGGIEFYDAPIGLSFDDLSAAIVDAELRWPHTRGFFDAAR